MNDSELPSQVEGMSIDDKVSSDDSSEEEELDWREIQESFTLDYLEEHEPWLPDDLPYQLYPDKEEDIYPPLMYYGVAVTTAELYEIAGILKEQIFPDGDTSDLVMSVSNFFDSIAKLGPGRGNVMTHRCWSREGHIVIALVSNYTVKDMYPAGPAGDVAAVVNQVLKCDPPKVPKWYLQETDDMPTRL